MTEAPNLFADSTAAGRSEEHITEILARPGLRIERIVSTGQASRRAFGTISPGMNG